KTIRSNRPGRRKALSMCQGALVAARISTPSFDPSTPSSSLRNWLMTVRALVWRKSARLAARASTSSKKSTHGLFRRACWKTACRFFSEFPSHMFSTSCSPTLRNDPLISPAAADRLAVGPVQVGVVQGVDDLQPDVLLDRLHPADVGEGDLRPLHLPLVRPGDEVGRHPAAEVGLVLARL